MNGLSTSVAMTAEVAEVLRAHLGAGLRHGQPQRVHDPAPALPGRDLPVGRVRTVGWAVEARVRQGT